MPIEEVIIFVDIVRKWRADCLKDEILDIIEAQLDINWKIIRELEVTVERLRSAFVTQRKLALDSGQSGQVDGCA